jgi:hypothetical protein
MLTFFFTSNQDWSIAIARWPRFSYLFERRSRNKFITTIGPILHFMVYNNNNNYYYKDDSNKCSDN